MKAIPVGIWVVLAVCTHACANNNQQAPAAGAMHDTVTTTATASPAPGDTLPAGKIIDTVACMANAGQTYALYIPAKASRPMPVVYCFDPHASGALPVRRYKALADAFGYILVGSNNSKNGNDWNTTEAIWIALWNDTKKRLPLNEDRLYTCGFSGGAKVAGYIAMNHTGIKGVIANGAGLPDGAPATDYPFTFTAVAGEGDMNMTDLVAINSEFDKTHTRHRIIFFNGKHEWAPEKTMRIAFTGWQLDAMAQKQVRVNDTLISRYVADSKKTIDGYIRANQLVSALNVCSLSAGMLDGVSGEAGWFHQQAVSITSNPAYQQQVQAQQHLLDIELRMKQEYLQRFQQGDINYWTKMIADLQAKAKAVTPEGAMHQRLLAYLSLAFYSFSNQLISSNRNEDAAYVVTLYKLADPSNSEAWYFSAILHARSNQPADAESDLLKAVACGFTDKQRLHQQPEFQQLGGNLHYDKIEQGMKQ
jgi:hypothetical protein